MTTTTQYGFLRETREAAHKDGIDKPTGLHRTGLDEYLEVIFPEVNDWIHDKTTGLLKDNGKKATYRPDYRSESLKTIVEFDGLPHFQNAEMVRTDIKRRSFYEGHGYKVVRIPYFIQLTNDVVERLFEIKVGEALFDGRIPSLTVGRHCPASLCALGVRRMAWEFAQFPDQYVVNMRAMKEVDDPLLTGHDLLAAEYEQMDANTLARPDSILERGYRTTA